MTAEWNGLPFTLLPKFGFFNGSVNHAVCPLPCRTSLLFPQSRVLSVPHLLLSSSTGPLDALCASAFLVNSLSLTSVSPHLNPLFHQRLLLHQTMTRRLTSHGPLSRFPSLYGWGRGDPTPPGSGTHSWLFCPLISLGLALAESRIGVPFHTTCNREQVPSELSQFWTAHALTIIRAYADHIHSLDRRQPAAGPLQSWQGATPPDIMSMTAVRLSDSVSQFRQRDSSQVLPDVALTHASAPPPHPFPPPPDVPQPCHPVDPPSVTSPSPQPIHCCSFSPVRLGLLSPPLPPSTAHASGDSDLPPPVVVGHFAQHPLPPRPLLLSWIPASLRNLILAHLG